MSWFTPSNRKIKKHYSLKDIQVISEVSEGILSTLNLEDLLQRAVDNVISRYGFLGGVFLLKDGNTLYANTISKGKIALKFLNLIDKPVSSLKTDILGNKDNYIVKSIIKKQIVVGNDLLDFTRGVIPDNLGDLAKRLTNTRSCISIPVQFDGKVFGAFFISESSKTDFTFELPVLETFSNQLAIAIINSRLYEATEKQVKVLEDKNREMQALRRREQDMMDIMGHELRTPLSIIRISLGLLQDKLSRKVTKDPVCDSYLNRIKEALDRETRLLEAMLNSTKIESEKMEMRFEKVNVDSIVKDAMLAMSSKARKKELQFIYKPPASTPFVYADSVRLGEVVDNLVLNAIKYTEKGSVTIQITEEEENLRISVTDSGIGIPAEDIPHLGEKFYRVGQYSNNELDRKKRAKLEEKQMMLIKPGGTGLGLYVSYNLVSLMGGSIDVKSVVGKGSTFSFSLPKYTNQPDSHSKKTTEKDVFKRLGFTRRRS